MPRHRVDGHFHPTTNHIPTTTMMASRRVVLAVLLLVALFNCATAKKEVCDCTKECSELVDARVLETEKRVESLESSAQEARLQHEEEIQTLNRVLQEAKEHSQASLERANSLRKEHDDSLAFLKEKCENDQASCKETQEELVALQTQVEQLRLNQKQMEDLKGQVSMLSKEKEELVKSQERLAKDLHDSQEKLQVTNDKYLESSQNLLKQKEEYLELEREYSTTHVNFKLIRDDLVTTCQKIQDTLAQFWNDKLAPYWNKIATPLAPYAKFFISVTGPVLQSAYQLIKDVYHQQVVPFWTQHVVPFWNKNVWPKIEPTVQPWIAKHDDILASLSSMVQQQSHALYSYVKLLEGREDSKLREAMLNTLKYCDEHSDKVVRISEKIFLLFVGYWIVAGLIALRRHRKRKQAAPMNSGNLTYPNHARKKNQ